MTMVEVEPVEVPIIRDEDIIMSVECDEPEGVAIRDVWLMRLTPENLHRLWEEAKVHRTLFTEEIKGDYKKFLELFLTNDSAGKITTNGLFWVVDNFVGIFYITDIVPGREAKAHYSSLTGVIVVG